jgi:signal transduction histidine kinase
MKILHLEDSTRDAEITHALFIEKWPDCEICVVDNRADFVARLVPPPDIILSDYSMPGFNGLEALDLVREKAPDTPFIFLSGTIGEERATDALRAGASDYVLKDRPRRLIPAIERALNDARLRRERQVADEQMLRVQRLENIGMLAAGIAHDFNNVLSPVIMGISLFRSRLNNEKDQRLLTAIESSAMRGAGLVRQILGFARGVTGGMQTIQPKHTLKDLLEMMRQTFPKTIRIEEGMEPDLWPVTANPTQLHQVLLNLCVNARDALPKGGTITVLASNYELDEMAAAAMKHGRPGKYVLFEVSDSGTGISPEVVERIWEPFFTTKKAGLGTGLGLSTVRSIVESHHGYVTVSTQLGRGTTFRVLLPADVHPESDLEAEAAAVIPQGNGEQILVVDDDAAVREITAAALMAHGYRVVTAADGTEALAYLAPRALEIRAVITDLDMPNLDGAALAKVIGSLNPAIRVLLVSASVEPDDPRCQPPPSGAFLAKPFTGDMLLRTIHQLLDSPLVEPV